MKSGPVEGTQYYTYDNVTSSYKFAELKDNAFDMNLNYYTKGIKDVEVQVFKRTTKTSSEGAYKRTRVTSIEGIESDHDYYRIITLSDKALGPQRNEKYFIYND
jgi:hypothetical protein